MGRLEVWDGATLLGMVDERIAEYIDKLESRIEKLEAEPTDFNFDTPFIMPAPKRTVVGEVTPVGALKEAQARIEVLERRAAFADELAGWLKDPDLAVHLPPCQWWEPLDYAKGSGDCTCGLADLLARYDATQEEAKP